MNKAKMAGTQPPADVLAVIAQYGESFQSVVLDDLTASFVAAFFISCIMCGVAFLASLLLPKKRSADETENATPVVIH